MTSLRKPDADDITRGELRVGNLGVKVSRDPDEIREAQRLRYQIFFGEMGGVSHNPTVIKEQRDFDDFDEVCDHLLVLDHDEAHPEGRVVGTYRLLRREGRAKIGRFYTESEFDITPIKNYPGEVMELGRSCVHEAYRNRAVMQLLWRGIGEYVAKYDVHLMFGCASFMGTDLTEHALALSYLHHYHLAPENLRAKALPAHYHSMNLMPKEAIDPKAALQEVPALIKGYLRLNGVIGDGVYIDKECNSIDVSVVVKTDLVTEKYVKRYKGSGGGI
jgi:L-ornithine Nalpha-acyltransferase